MESRKKPRLANRLAALVAVFATGLALFGASTYHVLEKLEVNGPVYRRIALGKDLVADILPPPEYIIESYQVSLEMAGGLGISPAAGLARLKMLESEYNDRHAFWTKQTLERELSDALLVASYVPARTFFQIAFSEFGPALESGNSASTAAALKKMKAAYEAHRSAIDKAVKLATQANTAEEAGAYKDITFNNGMLIAIFVGSLALAIAVAVHIVRGLLKELGGEPGDALTITRRIASGDLTAEIDLREGDSSSLLHAIKMMQQMLAQTVTVIQTSVDAVRNGSEEIASGNMDLSSRTEHHASALEQTAATLENLTATVQQTAVNAQEASKQAQLASDVATEGGRVMTRVVGIMGSINQSSNRIAEITSEIDGIAFQTNILSLNAAVEAARAGAQGAGFAVVASEVRNLAQRSAAASKRIKLLIDEAIREAAAGQILVRDAGTTMQQIVRSVHEVTDIIASISEAAREESLSLAEVNTAVAQMGQVTQQNAALVEEAAAASASLHDQADNLLAQANHFTVASHRQAAPLLEDYSTASSGKRTVPLLN